MTSSYCETFKKIRKTRIKERPKRSRQQLKWFPTTFLVLTLENRRHRKHEKMSCLLFWTMSCSRYLVNDYADCDSDSQWDCISMKCQSTPVMCVKDNSTTAIQVARSGRHYSSRHRNVLVERLLIGVQANVYPPPLGYTLLELGTTSESEVFLASHQGTY